MEVVFFSTSLSAFLWQTIFHFLDVSITKIFPSIVHFSKAIYCSQQDLYCRRWCNHTSLCLFLNKTDLDIWKIGTELEKGVRGRWHEQNQAKSESRAHLKIINLTPCCKMIKKTPLSCQMRWINRHNCVYSCGKKAIMEDQQAQSCVLAEQS
jgi:hypothetical protein